MRDIKEILSPDTQAILLLCGHFGQKTEANANIKPLNISEYADLAQWLQRQNLRPADLLDPAATLKIKHFGHKTMTSGRLLALLMRGGALAIAVEAWIQKGLWIISRSDSNYPARLKLRLKQAAPPIFYGIGQPVLLQKGGLTVVGTQQIGEKAFNFAQLMAKTAAQQSITIISGGARGIDTETILTALRHGGTAVGVLAGNLTQMAVSSKFREALQEGRLTFICPFDPGVRFSLNNAKARNQYMYALAHWAVVVKGDPQEEDTWAGATEHLTMNRVKQWGMPLLVYRDEPIATGNQELLNQGAIAIDDRQWQELTDLRRQLPLLSKKQPLQVTELEPASYSEPETKSIVEPTLTSQPLDLFDIVWPHIEQQLLTEKTETELAEQLSLELKQLRVWLKRALKMGRIKKLNKPVRYIKTDSAHELQKSLF